MLNGLRRYHTISADLFESRTGLPWEVLSDNLTKAEAKGLLCQNHREFQLTKLGQDFYNDVVAFFM
jgi:coproporphyrinogen III oxidase-like Fe-S oxidoreductase